jgi:hypothetical protein
MIQFSGLIAGLKAERNRAQKKVEQIDAALAALSGVGSGRARSVRTRSTNRKPMSAAARKRIAAAQRRRWAKLKAAQRKR